MRYALLLLVLLAAVFATSCEEDSPVETPVPPTPPAHYVLVPAGSFLMGAPADEPGTEADERPQHEVTLTHGFFMHESEITNAQYIELAQWAYDNGYAAAADTSIWDVLDGSSVQLQYVKSIECEVAFDGGVFSCVNPEQPVKEVSFYGAAAFCDWLSLREGFPRAYDHSTWQCNGNDPYSAEGYRLPTEAEWEYACRAGSSTEFANGSLTYEDCSPLDSTLDEIAWYCGNSGFWSEPVMTKQPNAWGLYDMHGSVWEWCNDIFGPYASGAASDPVGALSGDKRVRRGGTWYYDPVMARSGNRHIADPWYKGRGDDGALHSVIGFRPVRTVP